MYAELAITDVLDRKKGSVHIVGVEQMSEQLVVLAGAKAIKISLLATFAIFTCWREKGVGFPDCWACLRRASAASCTFEQLRASESLCIDVEELPVPRLDLFIGRRSTSQALNG